MALEARVRIPLVTPGSISSEVERFLDMEEVIGSIPLSDTKLLINTFMQKLYIAGDSFASLSNIQPIGNSWSEILANDLGLDLINVARPASSNFSIALQIDWIIDRITPDDFLIVFLTDHYRKTLVDLDIKKDDNKHILEHHCLHGEQRPSTILQYSSEPRLIASTIHHQGRAKEYYRDWFDVEIQEIEDRLILTGVFAKLSTVTDKFIVCTGGYDFVKNDTWMKTWMKARKSGMPGPHLKRSDKKEDVTHQTFCIQEHQFVNYTSKVMLGLSEPSNYINHLDDMTHKKLAVLLKKKIRS